MMVVTRLYYNVYDIHFYSILFEIVKEFGGGGGGEKNVDKCERITAQSHYRVQEQF